MPFDIEKGYGEGETKKLHPHPIVRETDMVYISPPSDLAELLHLKVFHTPHKKKINGKIQRRLIGEQYMRGNEVLGVVKKVKAKDVLNAGSSELQTYGHVKLSNLLRKIRKLKVKKFSEQGYQKEVLDRLHQSSNEPRAISAGKPILHGLHDRTLDETIEWAFEYVEENISTISKTIFSVIDEIKHYAAWKEKNRLLKAGVIDNSLNSPRRKVAVIQGSSSESGPNQIDSSHLPFRRPKNIPLIDQLNRIDMVGFHKFIEAIGGLGNNSSNNYHYGKPETPQSPRQSNRTTNIWSNNSQSQSQQQQSQQSHLQPQSPRPPINRKLSMSQGSSPNSPRKQSPKLGMAQLLQTLDENSIAKPPSSVAGAYGSSTAASSHHPSINNQRSHSSHNKKQNIPSSPIKNREISTAPSQISNLTSNIPVRPSNSPKSESRQKNVRTQKYQENKIMTTTTITTTTTTNVTTIVPKNNYINNNNNNNNNVHTTTITIPSRPTSSRPHTSSPSGKKSHRKSVLMPSNGLQQQILTDDDTTLLVKVDRRDSDHQITAINHRWGGGSHTHTTTVDEEDEEEDIYIGDDNSDFGSIKYQKGAKTVSYSNTVELLTNEWNSQHLYRYNPEFDANEIQDPRVQSYYRRGVMREEYLKFQQELTSATTTRAEVTTERLVNVWEEFSNVYAREYKKINLLMDRKDFDRPDFIETLHECFLMDGDDKKLGQLGKNMMVDLLSMKRRAKHRIYCRKMEELSKSIWFITLLTKMREHTRKSFQRVPLSLYKFLAIIQIILMYGWPLTIDLFWQLIEKTIEYQDHKEIIVHRAIKAIREYLSIDVETFMNYLEKNDIQPCSELLAQIREIKQGRKRAERALLLKQKVVLGSYSPRDAKYNVKFMLANAMNDINKNNNNSKNNNNNNNEILEEEDNDNDDENIGGNDDITETNINENFNNRKKSIGKKFSINSLPPSNLALIREQSEGIADYGIDDRKGSLLDPVHRLNFKNYNNNHDLRENENDDDDDDDDDDSDDDDDKNNNNKKIDKNNGLSPSLSDDLSVEFESVPVIGAPKKRF